MNTSAELARRYAKTFADRDAAEKEARRWKTESENLDKALIDLLRLLGNLVGRNQTRRVVKIDTNTALVIEWGGSSESGPVGISKDKLPNCYILKLEE